MGKKPKLDAESKVWAMMATAAGGLAALGASKAISSGWRASTGRKPPSNPASPDVNPTEAVVWAMVTAAAVAGAKVFAQRRAMNYFVKSTGHLPPTEAEPDEH